MFCSGCGTEVEGGLNYCKRCGNRVAKEQPSAVAENLSGALPYIGVFGFLGFIAVLFLLLRSPTISQGSIMLVSLIYLAALFAICFLILRQTSLFTTSPRTRSKSESAEATPAYLKPVTTAQLEATSEEPISIAEHTTRELQEVRRNDAGRADRG